MSDTGTREPRDEAELLLPWYATDKLTEEERRKVEAWLEAHPEERFQLEIAEDERAGTVAANEALHVPSRASFDRLMAEVDADGRRAAPASPLFVRIGEWFGGFSPQMRGAMVGAAIALVVAQTAAIGIMAGSGGDGADFQTASDGASSAAGPTLIVSFAPNATIGNVDALLGELGARIADGPRAGNIYTLQLAEGADQNHVLDALRERDDLVSFAAPGN